ncbi:transglutaminase TgpA family protein [Corallococcus interemptor]|uniref:transglutaminase TgpA family protein n=1 Tax=Corallococcus interemptor TaxID=2316720 RepID=UPI003D08D859
MNRPLRLKLTLRDLAAGSAFGAMAVSGQLPLWALAVFFLALVLALFNVRLVARHARLSALALLVAAVLLGLQLTSGAMNAVVAACSFAGLIAAQRMLSAPDAAAEGQTHLTGLLMVAGGAALSGDMTYALCLIAFGVLASLSLALGVVESAVPDGEPVPVRAVMRPLSVGLAFAVAGAVAFFVLFPRLNWAMVGPRSAPGLGAVSSAGYSNTVRLGGAGTIKSNPRVVLRATLTPDPGKDALEAYWVGRTYDTFDGMEWTNVVGAKQTERQITLRPASDTLLHQRIELLPAYGARTLIALEMPSRLGNAMAHTPTGTRNSPVQLQGGGEVRFTVTAPSYTYEAYSLPPDAKAGLAAGIVQAERDQLLALPEHLDPRVAQLAARVLQGEKEPLAAARKLAAFLQRDYAYTLEQAGTPEDPLSEFLFVRKAGHCEHFATALTLMLRTQGIGARLATGFYGGTRVDGGYLVRAGDAHAWTHVLVPDRGFVTVDATPPSNRTSQGSVLLEKLLAFYEAVEARWRNSVVDYSFRDQFELASALVRPPRRPPGARESSAPSRLPPARAWVTAAVVGFVIWRAGRFVSRWTNRAPVLQATRFLDRVDAALRKAHVPRFEHETLEDLTTRLAREGHPLALALTPLTRRYLEARFGGRVLREGEAEHLLATLRRALEAEAARRAARPASQPGPTARAS